MDDFTSDPATLRKVAGFWVLKGGAIIHKQIPNERVAIQIAIRNMANARLEDLPRLRAEAQRRADAIRDAITMINGEGGMLEAAHKCMLAAVVSCDTDASAALKGAEDHVRAASIIAKINPDEGGLPLADILTAIKDPESSEGYDSPVQGLALPTTG